jgi:2-haloacid dehalogenase
MVAAHGADLEAAASAGLRTAYIHRPLERGAGRTGAPPPPGVDLVGEDLLDLAIQLGV